MRKKWFLSLLALLMGVSNAVADSERIAWIEETRLAGSVMLQVFVTLPGGASARYEFEARKSGISGSTVNRQAGKVEGGRTAPISTSRISLGDTERLTAKLTVTLSNGEHIEDVVDIPGSGAQ